jgi:FAD/FMN-containing dehydrogenase
VLGVEAVLADGRVVRHLDGLEKDNTGYDLPGLLCGSEGTLAVITAARLRLVPQPTHVVVALLAFDAVEPALHGEVSPRDHHAEGGGAHRLEHKAWGGSHKLKNAIDSSPRNESLSEDRELSTAIAGPQTNCRLAPGLAAQT